MSNNITIYADGVITGGKYDNIKVYGSADITGEVEADNISVFGSTDFKGKCKFNNMKVFGACEFKDFVEVKEANIKGACEFLHDVKVEYLKVYGAVEFKKTVFRATEVIIYGAVEVFNLEADLIDVSGVIECKEQLNGDTININTLKGSSINEMVGTNITVKPKPKRTGFLTFSTSNKKPVEINTIEGDHIYLENVHCKAVRGNNIEIGPDCKIDEIEYHETCKVSDKSTVKSVEKY